MSMPAIDRRPRDASEMVQAQSQTNLLRVLAHPVRLQLLWLLVDEDLNVNALADRLGKPQAIVSQQLRILRMAGLVESSRSHGFAIYRITEPNRRDLLRGIHEFSEKLSHVLQGH